jgi:hypothetical protein
VADVKTSATCYDAALGALGLRRVVEMPDKVGTDGVAYGKDHPLFWIDRFHPHGVKQHTAFRAASNADVDAFYATGLALVARITARPDCAQAKATRQDITRHFYSTPMATISRPFAVADDAD